MFETMLVVDGVVQYEAEHWARMARSALALGLGAFGKETFGTPASSPAEQGASRSRLPEDGGGTPPAQPAGRRRSEHALRVTYDGANLTTTTFPIPEKTRRRRQGARVLTLPSSLRRAHPEHKLLSYLDTMPKLPDDIEEALFLDADGHVLEGTNTNVFAVDGETLITAGENVLPGIIRAQVIERAKRVILRPPTIEELRKGSFLTSSLTLIAPIVSIDGIPCAPVQL